MEHELRSALKRIFTGYRRLTPKMARELSALGITVARQRKHVILIVGASRRIIPISASGSDKRGGLNTVSDIMHDIHQQASNIVSDSKNNCSQRSPNALQIYLARKTKQAHGMP